MLAHALSRRLANAGIFYGWVVVLASFTVTVSTAGAMGLAGALILPWQREFGWSTSGISDVLAVRILLYGLIAPFAAAFIERYGLRRMILIAVTLNVAALVLSLAMTQFWQMALLIGLGLGVGTGVTALVMSAMVATRWFTERRGLVIGFLTASNATGQLVFLPLAAWLESRYGWRVALAPTLVSLSFAALLVYLFMVERPSELGLNPYGETGAIKSPPTARPALSAAFRVLGQVGGMPVFWVLAGTFFICGLSTNGLIQTHFISLCADYGVPSVTAASMLALIGICDFFGTVGSGWLSDRYDNRALLFVYYGLRGLSLLYLPSSSFSVYALSIFSVFYGLDWVATVPPTAKLSADAFGRERAGVAFGWIFASHMVGAAFAAALGGFSRTEWQTYLPAFYLGGAACLIAAVVIWLIERRPAPAPRPATA
jgi:MFS family permease